MRLSGALTALCGVALVVLPVLAKEEICHDWDGDLATAGVDCFDSNDCADGLWRVNTGSFEICDGVDNDCDSQLDQVCDRYCETPVLTQNNPPVLFSSEFPYLGGGDVALLPEGFLACSSSFLFDSGSEEQYDRVFVRRFDRLGQPVGPAERVGRDDSDPVLDEEFCRIAVGGDRVLVTWRQNVPPPTSTYLYYGRQLDMFGRPIGDIILISNPTGVSSAHFGVPVWNGESFGVFFAKWGESRLWLATIPRSPSEQPITKTIVAENLLNANLGFYKYHSVWTNDRYLVAFQGSNNAMATLAVDRNGNPIDSGHETIGDGTGGVALSVGAGEALMAWNELRAFDTTVWFRFVDPATGEPLTFSPTQLIPTSPFSSEIDVKDPIVTWTGEMFIVEETAWYPYLGHYEFDHWIWRILPDGTVLDPGGLRISKGPGPRAELVDMAWDGKEILYFYSVRLTRELRRARLACTCGDGDHDGRNSCVDDCDDSNSQVAPTRTEVCTGGLDEDCDGLVDCRDSNCVGGGGPAEVANLRWGGTGLVWDATATATRYAVARGLLSDLERRQDMVHAECAAFESPSTSWVDDGRRPPVGDVLWYQVRAEAAPCRVGPWGVEPLRASIQACD